MVQARDSTVRDDPSPDPKPAFSISLIFGHVVARDGTSSSSTALSEVAQRDTRSLRRASGGMLAIRAAATQKSSVAMTTASQLRYGDRAFETFKTVIEALLIAVVIRTLLFQPFNIPSGSMEPTLRVGDYLFVSKYSYGYSRYAFPLSLPFFSGRIAAKQPQRGDVVVFRNGQIDFIKRVIGLPGDRIQVIDGAVYLNGRPIVRQRIADFVGRNPCGSSVRGNPPVDLPQWRETLPNGVSYDTLECKAFPTFPDFTPVYTVPAGHFFMMGDNRENSEDSRFPDVGYVPFDDLIGRAQLIFFSLTPAWSAWEPWHWPQAIRWTRLFSVVR